MGINFLLGALGSITFDQPWVMTTLFALYYLTLALIALFRPVAAMVLYFGTSIMNPQATFPLFTDIPLGKVTAALGLLCCACNAGRLSIRIPAQLLPMLAFLGMVCVSASTAIHPVLADQRLEEFTKVGLMVMLAVWAITTRKDYEFFFWGILASLAYDVLKNLVETQTRGAWVMVRGVAGWINDSNDWALALAMGLPLFYTALAMNWHKGWKLRAILGVATLGALLTLTLTSSRGGFLAAAVSGTVFLLMDRRPWKALLVALAISAVVAVYMPSSYVNKIESIFDLKHQAASAWEMTMDAEQDYTGAERVFYWRIAFEIMKDHPLTGVGWGNFIKEFERRTDTPEGVVAHSTWFQVGAESGAVSLSLYLLMILFALVQAVRTWTRAKQAGDEWTSLHSRAIATGLVAFCVGGSFLSRENSELLFIYLSMAAILPRLAATGHVLAEVAEASDVATPVKGTLPLVKRSPS